MVHSTETQLEGVKGAKAAFQMLGKCCVFVVALSNEKSNFEALSEVIIT